VDVESSESRHDLDRRWPLVLPRCSLWSSLSRERGQNT
jgi:hypothetical protein